MARREQKIGAPQSAYLLFSLMQRGQTPKRNLPTVLFGEGTRKKKGASCQTGPKKTPEDPRCPPTPKEKGGDKGVR